MLATATTTASGPPSASTRRERFTPGLARSVGLGPIWSPFWRLAERPVRRLPGPVHPAEILAAFQHDRPQPSEDTPLDPALEVPMDGAVIGILARQPVPLTAGPPTVDHRVQNRP